MSREEFARILLDGKLSRREAIQRLTALGVAAPVATAIAMQAIPAGVSAAPVKVAARKGLDLRQGEGGTLIVGVETDIEGFDPGHAGALATTRVISNVLEGLVKYTPGTVELEPLLATEVPTLENGGITPDGLTYTFKLREGVTFHDGEAFNAEAVKVTYQRLVDQTAPFYDATNTSGFFLTGLTSVDVVDDYTVTMTLAAPNAAFLELSNIYAGRILSPKSVKEQTPTDWSEKSYGTGPFMVSTWEKGQKVELVRNDNYWGEKPALSTLIFRPIVEPTARVAALLAGEVDMIVVVPPDAVEQIQADANLVYESGPSLHYWFIQLNCQEGPFSDVRVRQAANYAVDKEGLANDVLSGSAMPATQPMPSANWSYNPDVVGYPYDPEKAKALLAEAGLADGFSTNMIIPQSGSGMMIPVQMNEFIQGNLADVGIDVSIQTFEWVSYLGVWAAGLSAEVEMGNQSIMASEPYVAHFLLASQFTPASGGWNIGYYGNTEVDALFQEAVTNPDRAARQAAYFKAWAMITEDAPWIFCVNDLQPMAFSSKVKGYVTNPAYVIDFTTISVD